MDIENKILPTNPSWKDVAKNLAIIILVIGIAYVVTVIIGLDGLREKVAQAGIYAPFILILLKATTIVVAPLGGTIIYPVAGALFGFWEGLLLTVIGDTIGSSIAFWISRRYGRGILHYFTGKGNMAMVEKVVNQLSTRKQFVKARIFFSGMMDLFAYAAGLTKINFWFFICVHMAVQTCCVVLLIVFGDALISANFLTLLAVGLGSIVLAGTGVWLFRMDMLKSN